MGPFNGCWMPLKHNLTKYDRLRERMHKTITKEETAYTGEDRLMQDMATLIVAFSSSKSWKTHREMVESTTPNFALPEIKEEYTSACAQKWKGITSFDISEVMRNSISQFKVEHWLYYNVPREKHESYKAAWSSLNELIGRDDDVEEMNDVI